MLPTAVALSAVAHVVIAWGVPRQTSASFAEPAYLPAELTVDVFAPEPEVEATIVPDPAIDPDSEPEPPRLDDPPEPSRAQASRIRVPDVEPLPAAPEATLVAATDAVAVLDAPSSSEAPIAPGPVAVAPFVLDPAAVARSSIGLTSQVDGPPRAPDRERQLARRLDETLTRATRPRHVSRRPPPELRRTRDGGYSWSGRSLQARITPEGEVNFRDLGAASAPAIGGPDQPSGAGFSFDIMDGMDRRRGNDPYYAERAWFMDETEELRDRLSSTARERVASAGLRGLRTRLFRIWSDEAQPAAQRRRALFRVWDDCSDDSAGGAARAAIEAFVRDRLPASSPDGFAPSELTRLNGARASEARFAPYGP